MFQRTAIIELKETNQIADKRTIAHIRIARFLRETLQSALIISTPDELLRNINRHFDQIVIMYASPYGRFNVIDRFIETHPESEIWWCVNEYNVTPNHSILQQFKKRSVHVLANYDEASCPVKSERLSFTQLNLNVSAFRRDARVLSPESREHDLIYYGTIRPDREKYFREYLQEAIISTSKKNIPEWRKMVGSKAVFIDKLNWTGGFCFLRNFKYSLYIEDVHTHDHFNFLADRFYEALSYQILPIFDANCLNSITKSSYKIPPRLIVGSKSQLDALINSLKNPDEYQKCLTEFLDSCLPTYQKELDYVQDVLKKLFQKAFDTKVLVS